VATNFRLVSFIVRQAYESGKIMPLEVQLEAMRYHWEPPMRNLPQSCSHGFVIGFFGPETFTTLPR
jgi:hypothetical protein